MKKITNFHILRITMRGFKRFCDEYSIDLDRITYIHGANGEGKSTIADAIAYAFCGTPFWVEKSCERLMNPDCTEMYVEVQFVDECGEVHTLTRRRNGSNTTIVFDTMTVRQSDVVNLFTEKDVFLSLINPLYFIEKIAEDGREFLQKLVPVVKQKDILAQMNEDEQTLLKHESLLDPEYFIKQRREEPKEYEESAVYLEGQRDLLNQQYNDAVAKLDAALKRGNEIAARKSELEKRQFEGINVEALKAKKMKFDSLNTEISALSTDCAKLAAKIKTICPGDICPTCRTAVTADNYRSIIAALRAEYDEMRTRGMEMIAKRDALGSPDDIDALIVSGNLTIEEFAELQSLTAQAENCRMEVELLYQSNDIPKRVSEIERQLSECAAVKKAKQTLIQAANAYAAKKAELTLQSLQMNRASIKLYDVVKSTGELKSVFRFTYDGKDYRWLSTSEKIRAGLEVSALLERLTGLIYPKYIDNAECITGKFAPINGQVILAYARNVELTATYPLRKSAPMKEAA